MAGDIAPVNGEDVMLNASITELHPSKLWIIRLAAKLAGCKIKVWKARTRKELAHKSAGTTLRFYVREKEGG